MKFSYILECVINMNKNQSRGKEIANSNHWKQ